MRCRLSVRNRSRAAARRWRAASGRIRLRSGGSKTVTGLDDMPSGDYRRVLRRSPATVRPMSDQSTGLYFSAWAQCLPYTTRLEWNRAYASGGHIWEMNVTCGEILSLWWETEPLGSRAG